MRLKSFYAKTMTEAMHMVRETLGEDAVIVATREENGGRSVRVTAAIEPQDRYETDDYAAEHGAFDRDFPNFELASAAEPGGADDWLQYDDETEDEESAVIEKLTDVMLRHSVPDEIVDQVISCATVIGLDKPDQALIAALEHLYSYRPLPQKPVNKAFMLVGPPGAGKTLATAKLAARSVLKGMRVAVISTDTLRAGGIEQLEAFTNILRINLQKADTPADLKKELEKARGADQIYIDTGGYNPFNPEEMRELARMMAAASIEPVLVMPAGIDADESGEMARIYAALGVRGLLPTRLDIARRLGGLLGAAHHGNMIFTDASNTPKVADGVLQLSPKRLAYLLMPEAKKQTDIKKTSPHDQKRTKMRAG
ncbi:MAG: GTPase [Rhodospirillales bacterium]|nr:GTPase [Rhodospirillales bacterium]